MTGWLCDTFGWACADPGEYVTRNVAPEIDPSALGMAMCLVLGVLLIWHRDWWRK